MIDTFNRFRSSKVRRHNFSDLKKRKAPEPRLPASTNGELAPTPFLASICALGRLWAVGMCRVLRIFWFAALVIGCSSVAHAGLQYERGESDNDRYILISGEFEFSDRIEAFLTEVGAHQPSFVTFNSPGGNIDAAMRLGRMIRVLGLNTLQIRQLECSSACALAFIGGVQRYAAPGSIGVHQSSFSDTTGMNLDDAISRMQALTAVLIGYFKEMGIDPGLLEVALKYNASDIRYLSASEMAQYHVTNMVPPAPPPVSQSAPPPQESGPGRVAGVEPQRVPTQPVTTNLTSTALGFVRTLVDKQSRSANEALANAQSAYAEQLSYFGKKMHRSEVLKDKEQYFKRWPSRSYALREDSVSVWCAGNVCQVTGLYDWFVSSLTRGKRAGGTASFRYVLNIGDQITVVEEDGKVLARR
jgi:hypothetical protein